jgi:hypothetical protein
VVMEQSYAELGAVSLWLPELRRGRCVGGVEGAARLRIPRALFLLPSGQSRSRTIRTIVTCCSYSMASILNDIVPPTRTLFSQFLILPVLDVA